MKMNCELVNKHIDELTLEDFTSGISNVLPNECLLHIQSCKACESALQNHHAYLTKLSNIEVPEFSEAEATAMLQRVAANASSQQPVQKNSGFLQGFIAASVLAMSIFGAWNVFNYSADQAPQVVSVEPEYFTTEVVLVINAPEDMYDADLNITLPQQIALEGYDNIQDLSWPVDLKAGANTLSLPIRVNKNLNQQLSIMAKLYHYDEEREFEIKVNVEPDEEDVMQTISTTRA